MAITTDIRAPPVIDFSAFYGTDPVARGILVEQVKDACVSKGFFQITGHGIPDELQRQIFEQSERFFALPVEEKMKLDKNLNPHSNRGYEALRSQNFEKRGLGDLKEGLQFGHHLPADHPAVLAKTINLGPNVYPESIKDAKAFKDVVTRYSHAATTLAEDLLRIIALTLGLEEGWFGKGDFNRDPIIATLKLLHYPSQGVDSDALERGIGAHTDFGSVTILLQDSVGGLQVYDSPTSSWIDVKPTPGALVINLGNLMMRWSNDRYVSNLHRVINKSGRERYSIPFFYNGNPNFVVKCLPGCEDPVTGSKYAPITVGDYLNARYNDTYVGGKREGERMEDPSAHLAAL